MRSRYIKKALFLLVIICFIVCVFVACDRESIENQGDLEFNRIYALYKEDMERKNLEALSYGDWVKEFDERRDRTREIDEAAFNKVSFYAEDEEISELSTTIIFGSCLISPTNITKEGYSFLGWYCDDTLFDFSNPVFEDLIIQARFGREYTVHFQFGNSEDVDEIYLAGQEIIEPNAPEKQGYQFSHYELNGDPYIFGLMPEFDITLVAIYELLYTIDFDLGTEDLSLKQISAVAGTKIEAPELVRDNYILRGWLLDGKIFEFDVMPNRNITLTASWMEKTNLPLISIDLYKDNEEYSLALVDREKYVDAKISLFDGDEEMLESVKASFRGRGNGSWAGGDGKSGYKIKFDKKQSLFGREANKHWVLIACLNFNDKSLARNYLAYNMANDVFTNIEYTTNAKWVDLYINGNYHGVYVLCEHVRVDKGRVDIKSEYGKLDTGYLIEYDAYANGIEGVDYFTIDSSLAQYGFTVHSPDPADYSKKITEEAYRAQVSYIKDYVESVYKAVEDGNLALFCQLADVDSFVDMYILQELFKNTDAGYSSFYMYKKPNGKLYAGPAWDFDGTMTGTRGDNSPTGIYVAGSVTSTSSFSANKLLIKLYETSVFINLVKTRWQNVSPSIKASLNEMLNEEVYLTNKYSMGKNFVRWELLTQEIAQDNWLAAIRESKQWLDDRIVWLDEEWSSNEGA